MLTNACLFTTHIGSFLCVSTTTMFFSTIISGFPLCPSPPPGDATQGRCGMSQRKGFPVLAVCCSKERAGKNETGLGSELAEQILESQAIQDGDSRSAQISTQEGIMADIPGPPGLLLTNPHQPLGLPVSGIPSSGGDIQGHQIPSRTLARLRHFHTHKVGLLPGEARLVSHSLQT